VKKKIYYHDTDCGGVVYYANYLKYMEEARTEYLAERGISVKEMMDLGVYFVVAHQEIDYKFPARYADSLEISTKIARVSTAKIEYEHEVKNQKGQVICSAKVILVCVDAGIRPVAIPQDIGQRLSS
jgi:acyl-CoA thioester hydrolase